MASLSGGVRIDLDKCPLKYHGLAPWEILVSESQERMSLAVPPERVEQFLALAGRRDVEATVVGEFTAHGVVEVTAGGKTVGLLELDFLHDGLPVMELRAEWAPQAAENRACSRALPASSLHARLARRPEHRLPGGMGQAVRPRGAGQVRGQAVCRRSPRRTLRRRRCFGSVPAPTAASPSRTGSARWVRR